MDTDFCSCLPIPASLDNPLMGHSSRAYDPFHSLHASWRGKADGPGDSLKQVPRPNTLACGWTSIFPRLSSFSMSIITGRGDSGDTDLLFGKRIAKTSLRIEALGNVDELNAALGLTRAAAHDPAWIALIDRLQALLVGLMGQLACLPEDEELYKEKKYSAITEA
ncbi:MAG: ATP:cob(I)alamin adenosyltransferase, partial [Verrucomicrobiaceae bacterium]